ncbi:hypothetical protein CO083_06075 [Candidatus Roizmanbacteria bacterium CG_4_9_14_0_8_um_filter_34_12]|uniref:CHAT domain-containing protein n=6 Tax=Candidatus Roizmaniibacteriota TaxID=1752723 RepID=A0A2M7BY04_9BACT|nr:hypothetical protein [Candidatus Roizmanbacteria bacterium]PIP64231.1 MAG: hypothetical protein COW96_03715 [Candidatus Roizmanbacteria bacterium CG22_combo_CG10-13_8_21_14_all_33_16]PIV11438.1 MAG: hypothetical protein COS50_00140 [Candidatus Roizmanbacteria bacterium CG03_land_8_20_14_0_80_35_26]PIX73784.1 MAG: hypothetical protein COZ39_01810 [Candidatus Roizmanbacteria bacterium CG_4_10_14_3_um_filter_33_21]PIY71014.1 MAG: hypothetical protein COY88_02590 [Candidatus Roizmanbacteria bact
MNKSILITRPNHDLATTYLYWWSKKIIDKCLEKKIKYFDLKGKKASKKNFDSYLKKNNPSFIFINGHGSEDVVTGWNNEILLKVGDRLDVKDRVIYARSCMAGLKLGKVCVDSGAKTFIGYTKNYVLLFLTSRETRPLTDNLAALFLEPSNLIPISLIKGNTVEEADRKSKDLMKKNLKRILSSDKSDKKEVTSYLWHDIKYQTVIGNNLAKI